MTSAGASAGPTTGPALGRAVAGVVREASIGTGPISVDRLLGLVRGPEVGGVALFVGVVRDHDGGHEVVSLDYTAHPTAGSVLQGCATQVAGRHDLVALAVEHRVGHLEVGDLAVVVAAGAVHRAAALAACAELIDDLKAQVPIWKEQLFVGGEAEWVGLPQTGESSP
ncbi:molybdenum cofactor biosynthesis protein MoaE [uncultured Friedmanniella sp.]|uniref:molybdenum cofactor biosynthesis protein MoaE n=1 Tax=uncultured Friedmanniella sp. TaxID=335381 RepID=UPI0035CB5817